MFVETIAHAHEIVARWRGAKPGKSPESWRRDAAGRRANAAQDMNRGRTNAAAIEIAIAEIFEAAAVEREAEQAAQVAAYDARKAAETSASDVAMRDLVAKRRRN